MRALDILYSPLSPLRSIALPLTRRFALGTVHHRVRYGGVDRPHYAYCVYQSAMLARRLRYRSISVIEFGVAGGNGLVALERHALEVSRALGIEIEVYGFDTGQGLPPPYDYRDLPYHWRSGFFQMEQERLERRLRFAKLVLGDIRETSGSFFSIHHPSPIAAVMYDLDFYSSTVAALNMLETEEGYRLPRIFCYFDDIIGSEVELYNDFTGVRLAIEEFNRSHAQMKFSKAYHLLARRWVEEWYHQIYILHDFRHRRYNDFVSSEDQQLPLRE